MKNKIILSLVLVLLAVLALFFYIALPAISINNPLIWLIALVITFLLSLILFGPTETMEGKRNPGLFLMGLFLVIIVLGSIWGLPAVNTKTYSGLFDYTIEDFDDFEATLDTVPLLDRYSSDNIALRRFGELADMVSQYKLVDSEQIVYQNKPVRVSLLEHAGFWRWQKNKVTPGYILVDMQTQKAELVRSQEPIVYSETTRFNKNIYRYIRFKYPTTMHLQATVELDEDGDVYWIAPTFKRVKGLFGGYLIDGLITVNAHTGEHHKYTDLNEIPSWIDNVYPSDYITEQYNYKGRLTNGYLNTWFSKTGMTMTTEGYNYMPIEDDIWMFTGITSVSLDDESNIGFILTNKRTKETKYYAVTGAEEFSAMRSAEGEVQHLGYTATFPLLLNVEGVPTYLLSLKDKSELVKSYAMVQVEDYRNVVVDTSLNSLKRNYLNKVAGLDLGDDDYKEDAERPIAPSLDLGELVDVKGRVSNKEIVSIGGQDFILLEIDKKIYAVHLLDNIELVFIEEGQEVEVQAYLLN